MQNTVVIVLVDVDGPCISAAQVMMRIAVVGIQCLYQYVVGRGQPTEIMLPCIAKPVQAVITVVGTLLLLPVVQGKFDTPVVEQL